MGEPVAGTPTDAPEEQPASLVESVLDSLSAWTVVALLIGLLYLVWATIEILGRYVGSVPSVGP